MTELWKEIPGFEGRYEVSTRGRVRNYKTKRVLSTKRLRDGYPSIRLTKDNNRKNYYVHRLVALVFIPNPENKPCVDHVDRNRQNNCVDNLRWATYADNAINRNNSSPGVKSLEQRVKELEEEIAKLRKE